MGSSRNAAGTLQYHIFIYMEFVSVLSFHLDCRHVHNLSPSCCCPHSVTTYREVCKRIYPAFEQRLSLIQNHPPYAAEGFLPSQFTCMSKATLTALSIGRKF